MYSPKVRKLLVIALVIAWGGTAAYYLFRAHKKVCKVQVGIGIPRKAGTLEEAIVLLKTRKDKDKEAAAIFNQVLKTQPDNIEALWGKAEALRRSYDYPEAEKIFVEVLKKDPNHVSSLNGLAYIRYIQDRLDESLKLVNQALDNCPDKENEALSYMMIGTINSKRSSKGGFFSKIKYGTQIKGYFLKARDINPGMPEVHLGLGTFYLKAPSIIGGDLDKAIQELKVAEKLSPEFSTVNARLAQAYKEKGDSEKFNYYYEKTKKLDPENEALQEIK